MTKKRIAHARDFVFEAIIQGVRTFHTRAAARAYLDRLKSHYVQSNSRDFDDRDHTLLWVKEYMVSEKERLEGYMGSFASIKITKRDDGVYILIMKKEDTDLNHPGKAYMTNRTMPNKAHPVIKKARRGAIYPTWDSAWERLENMSRDYPMSSVPNKDKGILRCHVYGKTDMNDRPHVPDANFGRYILSIKRVAGGVGVVINIEKNPYSAHHSTDRVDIGIPVQHKYAFGRIIDDKNSK